MKLETKGRWDEPWQQHRFSQRTLENSQKTSTIRAQKDQMKWEKCELDCSRCKMSRLFPFCSLSKLELKLISKHVFSVLLQLTSSCRRLYSCEKTSWAASTKRVKTFNWISPSELMKKKKRRRASTRRRWKTIWKIFHRLLMTGRRIKQNFSTLPLHVFHFHCFKAKKDSSSIFTRWVKINVWMKNNWNLFALIYSVKSKEGKKTESTSKSNFFSHHIMRTGW